jgi:hypothetical protein
MMKTDRTAPWRTFLFQYLSQATNPKEYAHLLGDALPHVIHTESENDRCTAVLEKLLRQKKRTAEEKWLAELLTR